MRNQCQLQIRRRKHLRNAPHLGKVARKLTIAHQKSKVRKAEITVKRKQRSQAMILKPVVASGEVKEQKLKKTEITLVSLLQE
jgi:thioredoxin reductase